MHSVGAKRFDLRSLSPALLNLRLLLVSTNFMSLVFLFLLFRNSACQQEWICNGTSCYKLVTSPKLSWGKAKEECEKCQARLVKVESHEENDFIKTELLPTHKNGSYWIGLSDSANETDWMWTDGTQLDSDGYKNWGDDQPDNNKNKQNCVAIQIRKSDPDHYGKWHDRRCSHERNYICENLQHVDSFLRPES